MDVRGRDARLISGRAWGRSTFPRPRKACCQGRAEPSPGAVARCRAAAPLSLSTEDVPIGSSPSNMCKLVLRWMIALGHRDPGSRHTEPAATTAVAYPGGTPCMEDLTCNHCSRGRTSALTFLSCRPSRSCVTETKATHGKETWGTEHHVRPRQVTPRIRGRTSLPGDIRAQATHTPLLGPEPSATPCASSRFP